MAQRVRRVAIVMAICGVAVAGCGGSGRVEVATTVTTTATTDAVTVPTTVAVDRQALLDDLRRSYGAPGAVAVMRDGDVEWSAVSGAADVVGGRLGETTRFRIGSVTKSIVATLVLDAVGRGELSLDDVVSDLLPGILRPDPPTTVRTLLDHTSGIFNVGDEGDVQVDIANLADPDLRAQALDIAARYLAGERVSISDRLYVALADTHDRYFDPGTGYHYSNVNYQLAAMVLAKVTGQSLGELLRARFVQPLGLVHTTLAPDDTSTPEMHGYSRVTAGGALQDLTDDSLAMGNGGSGGVISTAGELLTIMQAIASGSLLPAALMTEMRDATTQSNDSYGLGLATYRLSCGTFYGHGGAIAGIHSIAIASADGARGVAIAVNLRTGVDPDLLTLAESLLCG